MKLYLVTTTDYYMTGVKLVWAENPEGAREAANLRGMIVYTTDHFEIEEVDLSNPILNHEPPMTPVMSGRAYVEEAA